MSRLFIIASEGSLFYLSNAFLDADKLAKGISAASVCSALL